MTQFQTPTRGMQVSMVWNWKVRPKRPIEVLFDVPKSSFGEHNFGGFYKNAFERDKPVEKKHSTMSTREMYLENLWFPNEDFGRPVQHSGTHFQTIFHIREYSIWATFIWKVLWKCVPECWLGLPKSSFGDHKITNIWFANENVAMSKSMWVIHFVSNLYHL